MAVTGLRTYQHLACVCFEVVDKAALLLSVAECVGTWYLASLSHCACDRSEFCFVDAACHFLHRSCLCSKAVLPACLLTIIEAGSACGGADHVAEHLWMHNLWIPEACFLLSPIASLDAQSVDSLLSCEACLCCSCAESAC